MLTSTVSGVSVDSHVAIEGMVPAIQIVKWGSRITLTVQVGDSSMCWYLRPADGDSIDDYVDQVKLALGKISVRTTQN